MGDRATSVSVQVFTVPSTIILIGRRKAGKSAIGRQLAAQLGEPFADLGRVGKRYYAEAGHDRNAAREAWETNGMLGFARYQAPFDAHAVVRGLQEHSGVIELGAFQVALDDGPPFDRVRQALQTHPHVMLLLPSPNAENSIDILDARGRILYDGLELNEHFIRHHSNHDLAKQRIYTEGRTPAENCEDILQHINPTASLIVLIGPAGAGKSTLGKLLGERLQRTQISLDKIRWDYYKEIGYEEQTQREIDEREGFGGVYRYWKRFEGHAVARALQDHQNCVMDFGAGHSVYEDDAEFAQVQALLSSQPNVVLILPSPDLDESVALLQERNTPKIGNTPLTRYLVTHPAFRALATQTVYTQGKSTEESCMEIAESTLSRTGRATD
jgi:shikimate kinase